MSPSTSATVTSSGVRRFNRSNPSPGYRPRINNTRPNSRPARDKTAGSKEHEILFQKFFKSVGPRTYAAQVKRANNGNHYLVLMEGKRDDKTGEVRKTRVFVFGEDFVEFFRLVKSAAEFIKLNPVSPEVKTKRDRFWSKQRDSTSSPAVRTSVSTPKTPIR